MIRAWQAMHIRTGIQMGRIYLADPSYANRYACGVWFVNASRLQARAFERTALRGALRGIR